MSSTIVNVSADPNDLNAGICSAPYADNPVEIVLDPGTYTIGNIGIADGSLMQRKTGRRERNAVYLDAGSRRRPVFAACRSAGLGDVRPRRLVGLSEVFIDRARVQDKS